MTMRSFSFSGGEFQVWYENLRSKLENNLAAFREMLWEAFEDEFDVPFLERITIQRGRVKKPNRTWEKIKTKDYPTQISVLDDIPQVIHDLIGTRIICTNIADLEQIRDYLYSLPVVEWGDETTASMSVLENSRKDYVKNVKESGYRSIHVTLVHRFPVHNGHLFATCEIQARTLLQDAWGELTHEETYKPGAPVPSLVKTISRQMSDLLATLDDMAQTLRRRK